ncbi:hypothetical protein NHJ13051_009877 [Beauveria bassiana]
MSQENAPSHDASPPEACDPITLILSNASLPDPASWEHVLVALSSSKQDQIMRGIGRSHSEASRFSTWSVIGESLSMALISESAALYMQLTMTLHRKDFLLFKRKTAANTTGTAGIIEVDFTQKLEATRWQGHWQNARPTLAHFVRQSLDIFHTLDASRSGQDSKSATTEESED